MMTLRAGRRAFYLSFAALCGIGGSALPAAAQSYLADNGSSVTVDYSVLGQGAGPGPVMRNALPGGALPAGGCSCANAPMGVIAAAPHPTFANPFATRVTQAPAVPPGFLAYSQIAAPSRDAGAVVLTPPKAPATEMVASAPPVTEEPAPALPAETPTQNGTATEAEPNVPAAETSLPATTPTQNGASAPAAEASLPATTPTQSVASAASGEAEAPSGAETPPAQPEEMPTNVPSPVEQPEAQAPAEQAPVAESPAETAPAEQAPAEQAPAEQAPAPTETQTAEAPPETPPADTAQPAEPQPEQQAAVTPEAPAAPAEGATPPAEGGALPAGATRILYTGETDDVPASATADLDKIAQDMLADQEKRIQVMCYAAGTEDTESKARRKSLARGLAIRSYLIKAGVPSTRIDVRALGNKTEGGPADRVDLIPAS
jgi:outer membrane protein OmpA-like peptidoglycan-associated protein